MAIGKYSRVDNRRSSSSYCSTVTIVVFVALCLVGVWMMTSSSVVPVQNVDVSQENKNEVKEQNEVTETVSDSNSRPFEDNQGDLPEDATKGDNNATPENNNNSQENQEKTEEKSEEKSSEDTRKEDGDQRTEDRDSKTENTESGSEASENEKKSDSDESEKKSESDNESETTDTKIEEKVEQNDNKGSDESSSEKNTDENAKNQSSNEVYPSGAQSELQNESTTQTGSFKTQAAESKNEKESQESAKPAGYNWKLCNTTAGPDYIPCLDNLKAIKSLRSTKHYEHRERHCPEEPPTCLVPLPEGYKRPIEWPQSREKVEID